MAVREKWWRTKPSFDAAGTCRRDPGFQPRIKFTIVMGPYGYIKTYFSRYIESPPIPLPPFSAAWWRARAVGEPCIFS